MKTTASNLKAKLGRFMKAVKAGHEVVVTDRGAPVARLVPFAAVEPGTGLVIVRPADPSAPPPGDVVVTPVRAVGGRSSTEILRDDRDRR
jgi:prevent-host-death family protein